jgi:hypothetical protein
MRRSGNGPKGVMRVNAGTDGIIENGNFIIILKLNDLFIAYETYHVSCMISFSSDHGEVFDVQLFDRGMVANCLDIFIPVFGPWRNVNWLSTFSLRKEYSMV